MRHTSRKRRAILGLAVALGGMGSVSAQSPLQVGYSVFTSDTGGRMPVGSALFQVTNSSGVMVSEAGVGAAEPIRSGRIFVDEVGTKMGLALVNTGSSSAAITFILRNSAGAEISRRNQSLGANQHLSRYVHDLFPDESVGLRGSQTLESSQTLAAVTLRENRNVHGEPLYTTLPVVNLAAALSTEPVIFPHIAAGGGFTTELLLMNPTSEPVRGEVRFYGSNGASLSLQSGNQSVSQIPYDMAANGTFRAVLDAPALVVGWAAAVPSAGNRAPDGSFIRATRRESHPLRSSIRYRTGRRRR